MPIIPNTTLVKGLSIKLDECFGRQIWKSENQIYEMQEIVKRENIDHHQP